MLGQAKGIQAKFEGGEGGRSVHEPTTPRDSQIDSICITYAYSGGWWRNAVHRGVRAASCRFRPTLADGELMGGSSGLDFAGEI